jgi:hypothetical protein
MWRLPTPHTSTNTMTAGGGTWHLSSYKNWTHEMRVLILKARNTSHFDRTYIHMIQANITKWGMIIILLAFLPQSGEYNSFFASKNDRTVSVKVWNW